MKKFNSLSSSLVSFSLFPFTFPVIDYSEKTEIRMAADRTQPSSSSIDGFFDSREEKDEIISSIQNKQDEGERREIREKYRQFQDELSGTPKDLSRKRI